VKALSNEYTWVKGSKSESDPTSKFIKKHLPDIWGTDSDKEWMPTRFKIESSKRPVW
jgi:hypothetical protein